MKVLSDILANEYGVGALHAPKEAVLWACEKIPDKEQAKSELKKLNILRERYGKPLVYAPYGHHAF